MKKVLLAVAVVLTGTAIGFAANKVYKGEARSIKAIYSFTEREEYDVKKRAGEDGVEKCYADGNTFCRVVSVRITTCNYHVPGSIAGLGCDAEAIVFIQ
jgi:hypothetical protein